ncbi:hypothetical protein GQ53DRAFT_874475 [Thozetella sp. PMI_491]|nr:hypothetical protein GQ53DRAFT_874475 [Thozetella sp. PMI_491]
MATPTNWTTSGVANPYQIYTGVWTNWSRGSVMGLTVTLSRNNGNLVIAFAASFVAIVSSRFWRILCLVLHRYYSTPKPKDALHHQRQAILRNSANSEFSLWKFFQLCQAWRHRVRHAFFRVLPVLAAATLCFVGFTVAGGFSSHISTGISNAVLLDGPNCGIVKFVNAAGSGIDSFRILDTYYRSSSEGIRNSINYAQQCYSANRTGVFGCESYVVPRLSSSVDTQAPCPFADTICRSNNSNLRLDSGYIDSHIDLGLNSPPDQRILFREVFHCAPLKTQGYKSNLSDQYINYTAYNYGPILVAPTKNNVSVLGNYTYRAPTTFWQYNVSIHSPTVNGAPYISSPALAPIPELARTDADLFVYFLQGNGVLFLEPVYDPWYRATVPGVMLGDESTGETLPTWRTEEAASPLGCTLQFQFCNTGLPEGRRCGPLASQSDAYYGATPLFNISANGTANTMNGIRFKWFWSENSYSPSALVNLLGPQSLVSTQGARAGIQTLLPSNQWQLDVTNWWEGTLASLQIGAVLQATGPNDPSVNSMVVHPNGAEQEKLCHSQMILSTDYTSFSVFGLCFIFASGVLIIIVSFVLEPILGYLERRHKYKSYELLEWQTGETLQLQRLGYQGLGTSTWSHGTDSIPLTKAGEILESLALHQGEQADEDELPSTLPSTSTTNSKKLWFLSFFSLKNTKRNTEKSQADSVAAQAALSIRKQSEDKGSTAAEDKVLTRTRQSSQASQVPISQIPTLTAPSVPRQVQGTASVDSAEIPSTGPCFSG